MDDEKKQSNGPDPKPTHISVRRVLRRIARAFGQQFRREVHNDPKLRAERTKNPGPMKKLLLREIGQQLPLKRGARATKFYNRVEQLRRSGLTVDAALKKLNRIVHVPGPPPRDDRYTKLTRDEQTIERERVKMALKKRRQKRRKKKSLRGPDLKKM